MNLMNSVSDLSHILCIIIIYIITCLLYADNSGSTYNLDTSQISCISKLTENVTSQLQNYLRDPGTSFDILEKYPLLLDLAIKHNTPLTSSAPVERLLSYMNIIRHSRRPDLSNYPFEKLVLLKANSKFSD